MEENEKILIIDDDVLLLKLMQHKLGDRFNLFIAESGIEGLEILKTNGPFSLVAVDYYMPEMNGVEFLEEVRNIYPDTVRMMITGMSDLQQLIDVINNTSIFRIISKPCTPEVLGSVIEKGIEQYRLVISEKDKTEEATAAYRQLIEYAKSLNEIVTNLKDKNRELNNAYYDTINRLVVASEFKDEDTHDHIIRMSRYSALIAEKIGLSRDDVEKILFASPMHDIGKIGIPDAILTKPGKLSADEFNDMKKHTIIGSKILDGSKADVLKLAASIALSHHERWDGKGYPNGISGEEIPVAGRIASLADTFDALTSRRPYKEAYPVEVALDIIKKERGNQFDPYLVDVFIENLNEFVLIKNEISPAFFNNENGFILSDRDN